MFFKYFGKGLYVIPFFLLRQVCDSPEELIEKATQLANAIRNAKCLVVYTGAGVSTVNKYLKIFKVVYH